MNKQRKYYEKRAEILTKKLLSKIYALEAKAMENQFNVQKGIDKVNDKIDWDGRVKQLSEEREKLNQRYLDMVQASNDKWEQVSGSFENYFDQVNATRRDAVERANDWLDEANTWINDMEDRAVNYSQESWNKVGTQVENLKKQRDQLNERLTQLQNESNERMGAVKSSLENEINNLKTTVNNVVQAYQKEDKTKEAGQ